jgi:hypothetical protein
MEFRLLYSGEVFASANSKRRASEKHLMRQQFHPQLKRLWETNKSLLGLKQIGNLKFLSTRYPFNGYYFVPLIREELCLYCSIDILFLRPEDNGNAILQGGDLDGRIKTIFDALRMPKVGELAVDDKPQPDESPFFVLLEDDTLISEIKVTADNLLLLPGTSAVSPNHVFMSIHVRLRPVVAAGTNWAFGD